MENNNEYKKTHEIEIKPRDTKHLDLLREGYGEQKDFKEVDGKEVSKGEENVELTDEEKALLESDEDSLSHALKLRLGYLKWRLEQDKKLENDNDNGGE
ncbi:hypothetical protein LCY76_09465 [Fictibacillus sp. KIGAM418]|uniref:Uncharacterized protein n=1 Tax=Fictibacillus marinisediminis TaxID=2878389 RepID=A0A9X1XA14_9BACL|nr:hypothetical protein [Fictibacillus marinisediminis]MCK6256821.1 hypothetical protein [Fictibacillus marinisediminis]